jgi:predicted DNA-binding protein
MTDIKLRFDKSTDERLEILAEHEGRTKIGELRYLIKQRAKELGLKFKKEAARQ